VKSVGYLLSQLPLQLADQLGQLVVGQAVHDQVQTNQKADYGEDDDHCDGDGGIGDVPKIGERHGQNGLQVADGVAEDRADAGKAEKRDDAQQYADYAHDDSPCVCMIGFLALL